MEIIPKRLVDNVIENAVEEVKNEKSSEKKLPSLSEAINENDNSSKKIKLLHKKFFLSLSKIRGSERIAKKKIITIIKYGKYENRINRKTTKENLFGKLTKDSNSLFYSVKKINRNLLNKVPKSVYEKDKVFCKLFNKTENQDTIFDEEGEKIPSHTSFIEQKKGIDQSSTLHSIKAPFELFHADIANIKFLSKSAVDPYYCLLCVDLFSSKIYTYSMKKRSLLAKKMVQFYEEIETKRDGSEQMRGQTDLEFRQREIQKLN